MLIALVEADELLQQAMNHITKRTWIVKYKTGEINYNRKNRDKRTLSKIFNRVGYILGVHYELVLTVTYGELESAIQVMNNKLQHIQEVTQCDRMDLWLGPVNGSNFRYKSAKTQPYKGTRPPKTELLIQLREWLIYCKGAQVIQGYEADDALGIYQLKREEWGTYGVFHTIAVHNDKDIFMIPGDHYDTYNECYVYVDELGELTLKAGKVKGTGLYFFYYQMLVGDKTDNIPGLIKGKGPVWAYKVLEGCSDEKALMENVLVTYRTELADSGSDMSWRDRLLEQADLVWICRNKEETGKDYILRSYQELFGREL